MITILLVAVTVTTIFLIAASINDLKTSEIPEVISYTLFASVLLISLIAAYQLNDIWVFLKPIMIGAGFFIFSAVLFYVGMWGGGDVKLMASIGTLLGLLSTAGYSWPQTTLIPYYGSFWVNMAFLSIPYVFTYTFLLGLMNPKVFEHFLLQFKNKKVLFLIAISFIPLVVSFLLNLHILKILYFALPVFTIGTIYLKTCEAIALMKTIPITKLRLWDIPAEDIVVDGEKIASKRNIEGIDEQQLAKIRELAKNGAIPKKITIKWGVKFAPILLVSTLATIYIGDILEIVMFWLFSL